MRRPAHPPQTQALIERAIEQGRIGLILSTPLRAMTGEYLAWDKLRHLETPGDLSHEEWWLGLKMGRNLVRRELPLLRDKSDAPFHYTLPDHLLERVERITREASGSISFGEQVSSPALRDRYIVSSLIEEAITSSQLEGASTSRTVAKDMLRAGRTPRNRSEKMIFNNYQAMSLVHERLDRPLTPALVMEIHRVVTDDTLDDPDAAGAIQSDQSQRIQVFAEDATVLHRPPPVEQLDERLQRLCDFANGGSDAGYVPPLLRAIALHFMMGYDHYFEDGNGRTARVLFYWEMLREGFWLAEFITISHILRRAPGKYARSFLFTEDDEGDLTHFFLYQSGVVERAIANLHGYLASKAEEVAIVQRRLSRRRHDFNHRQLALLDLALRDPAARFTAKSHARSHGVSIVTARHDLQGLESADLLQASTRRRERVWAPVDQLADKL